MDKPVREAEPNFSQPVRQIAVMVFVIVLVVLGGYAAWPRVSGVFESNPYLNCVIIFVFTVGVLATFWQVVQIYSSVKWIKDFAKHIPGHEAFKAPRLLAPLASLLRSRSARSKITGGAASSILDSVATRMDEARDVARYLGNLLIFLGLLGTFWGLATTVPAVVDTIRSLTPKEGETAVEVFGKLMGGLQSQLGGMGTAFSSSLLGLCGSLVLGLLELFASHGQNRFYRELEEWLSSITRLAFASGDGEGGFDQGVVVGVLDHMAEQVEALQTMMAQSDISRAAVDERMSTLVDAVGALTLKLDSREAADPTVARLAEGHERMTALQERMLQVMERSLAGQDRITQGQERLIALMEGHGEGGEGSDAESRMRLRSIDVQLLRILEEISAGRQESISDLRGDLASLTAAIRQLSRGGVVAGRG